MTTAKTAAVTPATEFEEGADPTVAPADWQWETVHDGTATVVIFDNPGDEFVGQYVGTEHVDQEPNAKGEDQSFDRFIFLGRDKERYAINKSYALAEALTKVNVGDWCRILHTKSVKTGRNLNDMKDFKVFVKK